MTFGESKRTLSFSEDDNVGNLRCHFLRLFSDMLSEDIAETNVRFQKYDDAFEDYVDIGNDVKLDSNAKVKVVVTSKLQNQVTELYYSPSIRSNWKKKKIFGGLNLT